MMNQETLREQLDDSIIALLMYEFAEREGARYIEENERLQHDPSAAVPAAVERRALRLIERATAARRRRHGGRETLRMIGRYLVAAVLTLALTTGAVALSPAVRSGVLRLVLTVDDEVALWEFSPGEDYRMGIKMPVLKAGWLPEGYTAEDAVLTETGVSMRAENGSGGVIEVAVEILVTGGQMQQGTADADSVEEIDYHGMRAVLVHRLGYWHIVWADADKPILVGVAYEAPDADGETLLRVADNLKLVW